KGRYCGAGESRKDPISPREGNSHPGQNLTQTLTTRADPGTKIQNSVNELLQYELLSQCVLVCERTPDVKNISVNDYTQNNQKQTKNSLTNQRDSFE
ncbi:hypothetical protein BaRGS_00013359, partial [Batillaria attramentaria]